jgi:hypothetical protein
MRAQRIGRARRQQASRGSRFGRRMARRARPRASSARAKLARRGGARAQAAGRPPHGAGARGRGGAGVRGHGGAGARGHGGTGARGRGQRKQALGVLLTPSVGWNSLACHQNIPATRHPVQRSMKILNTVLSLSPAASPRVNPFPQCALKYKAVTVIASTDTFHII